MNNFFIFFFYIWFWSVLEVWEKIEWDLVDAPSQGPWTTLPPEWQGNVEEDDEDEEELFDVLVEEEDERAAPGA